MDRSPREPHELAWQPLPRVHVDDLSYERFLREFALPKQPFILEGASAAWPATQRWQDLSYIAERANPAQKVSYTTCKARWEPEQEKEKRVAIREALKRLRPPPPPDLSDLVFADLENEPLPAEPEPDLPVRYIKTWDYVRGGTTELQEDFTVPSVFDRSADAISKQVVLGHSETDMKWLYIGEPGTGSGAHIDTNNSSAWLWVARGAKRWRCIHGGDYHLFGTDVSSDGESSDGSSSEEGDGYGGPPLPDLFRPDVSEFPQLERARLFEGEQREGDICFNPTQCIHAVHNTRFTVSLTHNYVDATNLGDALVDVVDTFEEVRVVICQPPYVIPDLLSEATTALSVGAHGYWLLRISQDLEMLTEMRRKDRLEFWSDTLQVEEDGVCAALLGVAGLVSVS
jgi:histone arginine demethylase JMJD6